jgi:hypothetical protein
VWRLDRAVERDGEIVLILASPDLAGEAGRRVYTYRLSDMLDRKSAIAAAKRDLPVLLAKLNRVSAERDITAEIAAAPVGAV